MAMRRRQFIRSGSILALTPFVSTTVSAEDNNSKQRPKIPQDQLDVYNWEKSSTTPDLPEFEDAEHIENVQKTDWKLNAFHGTAVRDAIEEKTPFTGVKPLKHIWAAKVTTDDDYTEIVWSEGAASEVASNIDSTTESVFQRFVENQPVDGEFNELLEWHRGVAKQGIEYTLSQIPYVGSVASGISSSEWDLSTSETTATGHTPSISEHYVSLPLSAIAENGGEEVENEVDLDFRGIYIDWFTEDNVFYSVGGIYPESEERLNEQLTDGFDDGVLDFSPPDFDISTERAYEQEMLDLVSKVR